MTSAFAWSGAVAPHRSEGGPAGSQLHETWAASAARSAMAERRRLRRAAEREYRAVTAATFPIFLLVAAGARLMPRSLRSRLCGIEGRSVLGDARAMAAATIPIAFMA